MEKQDINVYDNLVELGLDSMVLNQIRNAIKSKFQIDIPLTNFFDKLTNIDAVSDYISKRSIQYEVQTKEIDNMKQLEKQVSNMDATVHVNALDKINNYKAEGTIVQSVIEKQLSAMSALMEKQLNLVGNSGINTRKYKSIMNSNKEDLINKSPQLYEDKRSQVENLQKNNKFYVPYKHLELKATNTMKEKQLKHLNQLIKDYTEKTKMSKEKTQEYRHVYANNRNVAGFRPNIKEIVYQIIAQRGQGSKMWDIDGNEYIDLTMGFGVNLFGHNPSFVNKALQEELRNGMPLGPMGRLAGEVAQGISELTGVERVAFYNSGTEAVMVAIRIARAATKKFKIAIFLGSYHGIYDGVLGIPDVNSDKNSAVPLAPGILQHAVEDVILLNYNDSSSLEIIKQNADELAAVLVEPVQSRRPDIQPKEFLRDLRNLTEEINVALIFDEMVTGFRICKGGAQEYFGVKADIVTYGKVIGGGMPIGVVSGKDKYMDCIDGGMWEYGDNSYPSNDDKRTFVAGTFCHHPLAMVAAKSVIINIRRNGDAIYSKINENTSLLKNSLNKYFTDNNIPIEIVSFGSLFRFVFHGDFEILFYHLINKGIYIWEGRNCFISTAHTSEDIEKIINVVKDSVEEMREAGFFNSLETSINYDKKKNKLYIIPITKEQEKIYISSQIEKDKGVAFNESIALELKGDLDVNSLKKSLEEIVARHDALRTVISKDGRSQIVNKSVEVKLYIDELSANENTNFQNWIDKHNEGKFNLNDGPLFEFHLLKNGEKIFLLVITIHHIICDGLSLYMICNELKTIYYIYVTKKDMQLPKPTQFREYCNWKNQKLSQSNIQYYTSYWKSKLKSSAEIIDLPTDKSIIGKNSHRGNRINVIIDEDMTKKLRKLSVINKCSLFITLLTVFKILIYKLTKQPDVVIGIPKAGQADMAVGDLIGNCINVIPVSSRINESDTFYKSVSKTKNYISEIHDINLITPEVLSEHSKDIPTPNINVMFNMDRKISNYKLYKLQTKMILPSIKYVKYDFMLSVIEIDKELNLSFDYNTELFSKEAIKRWSNYFINILKSIVHDSSKEVGSIKIIDEEEENKLTSLRGTLKNKGIEQKYYILDCNMNLVPTQVVGRLFVKDEESSLLKNTHKVAKFNEKGNLQILAPYDKFILVKGRYVNLNVVEDCVKNFENVKNCVVFLDENINSLVAYIEVTRKLSKSNDLVEYLKLNLQQNMIPKYFVQLEQNTVDFLKEINISQLPKANDNNILKFIEETSDDVEIKLIDIWKNILNIDCINVNDNFFRIGGDSLKAAALIGKIAKEFNININLSRIFDVKSISEMARHIKNQRWNSYTPMVKSVFREFYPVTSAQKRMYILWKFDTESKAYNIPVAFIIKGKIDINKIELVLNKLLCRHESLRTYFSIVNGELVQKISKDVYADMQYKEIIENDLDNIIDNFVTPFDLSKAPLIRFMIAKISDKKHVLVMDMHHIIADGTSIVTLINDFKGLYEERNLEDDIVQYKDFTIWESNLDTSHNYNKEKKYWEELFKNGVPNFEIQPDYPRSSIRSYKGERICFHMIDKEKMDKLGKIAEDTNTTLYTVLLASYNILLNKYTGYEDICVGTPVSGRIHPDLEKTVGMFVNTLIIKNFIDSSKTFRQFLLDVKQNIANAYANQSFSFDKIVEMLNIEKNLINNPIFNTMFSIEEDEFKDLQIGNAAIIPYQYNNKVSKFDFSLEVIKKKDELVIVAEYSTELYRRETIERLIGYYNNILNALIENCDVDIWKIDILNKKEKQRILEEFNNTEIQYNKKLKVNELFEKQVLKTPNNVALVLHDNRLTYKQLNIEANKVAVMLLKEGIKSGDIVALMVERNFNMLIGILAILKAGATYIPNVKISPKSNSDTLYADNKAVETVSTLGEVEVELETQDLPLEVQAVLLGHTLDAASKVMSYEADDNAPYVAVGFKVKKGNGKYRYVWLLKGKFSEPEEEHSTQEDKTKFQTPKLKGTFLTRADGRWKYTADEDSGFTGGASWFTNVYAPGASDLRTPNIHINGN